MGHEFRIRRLDQGIACWQELMWALRLEFTYGAMLGQRTPFPLAGPILHSEALTEHLLTLRSMADFDRKRFFMSFADKISCAEMLPVILAYWCVGSRRVYHIDEDLQAILLATSLKDLTWADVKPPFETFGISLPRPIRGGPGKKNDFLMLSPLLFDPFTMSQASSKEIAEFAPWFMMKLSADLENWEQSRDRQLIQRKFDRGKMHEAVRLLESRKLRAKNNAFATGCLASRAKDIKITDLLSAVSEPGDRDDEFAWRIVIGLCKYLRLLPAQSPLVSEWSRFRLPKSQRPSGDAIITDESQICTVRLSRQLTPEDREYFFKYAEGRLTGIELECHFREGHWRRPPGFGHLPVDRSVHVDPTIVRPDRWPVQGLPIGLIKNVH